MVSAFALISNLLLASAALAAPTAESRLAARLERRRAGHQSQPLKRIPSSATNGTSHEEYSTNWAGAVYDNQAAGTFTAVTGTFTVPTPTGSDGSSSAWVGIDGDTCGSAILQTGVDFTISGGQVSYDAWYEWFPAGAYDFDNFNINSGDVITTTVTATSTTSGTAVIENTTTGQTVTQQLSSSSALCQQNAEWIVEDFEENGGLVPFDNFGKVVFTNAVATTTSGTLGPDGATIIDIQQNGNTLTSSSADSSSVTVSYV